MRFIHTSDWHIGRQFHNISLLDDQRHVLKQLLAYIERDSVDALVIAGDIFDRSVPPAPAVELLDETLTEICMELKVPVILIPGNHDSAPRLRFGSKQLRQSGLCILGDLASITEPVIVPGKQGDTAFYGLPYHDPEMVRHLYGQPLSGFDEAHTYLVEKILATTSANVANVLISHCFIDGAEESESERPLAIGGSDRVSYQPCVAFDYVALGHLHSPQHRGASHIRYSGSILKYSFSEQHQKKGVTLVELDASGLKSTRHLPLKPLRDMRVLEGSLDELINQGKTDPNHEDYLLIRLTDRHAILDPIMKLREVYPNVLQLEKPGMLMLSEQQANRDRLKRNELDMFSDFFAHAAGQELDEEQHAAIRETIAELHNQELNS